MIDGEISKLYMQDMWQLADKFRSIGDTSWRLGRSMFGWGTRAVDCGGCRCGGLWPSRPSGGESAARSANWQWALGFIQGAYVGVAIREFTSLVGIQVDTCWRFSFASAIEAAKRKKNFANRS